MGQQGGNQVGICKRCKAKNPINAVQCWKCHGTFEPEHMKKCDFCKELLSHETVVCPYCGRRQSSVPGQPEESHDPKPVRTKPVQRTVSASTTRAAGRRKGRFCSECGSELQDSHKFCWNCGHSRTGSAPVQEPVWETCIIAPEAVKKTGSFSAGSARWCATATGPKGRYRAGVSKPFLAYVTDQEVTIATHPKESVHPREEFLALDALASRLVAEGWEPTGQYGASYWTKQYRRRIR